MRRLFGAICWIGLLMSPCRRPTPAPWAASDEDPEPARGSGGRDPRSGARGRAVACAAPRPADHGQRTQHDPLLPPLRGGVPRDAAARERSASRRERAGSADQGLQGLRSPRLHRRPPGARAAQGHRHRRRRARGTRSRRGARASGHIHAARLDERPSDRPRLPAAGPRLRRAAGRERLGARGPQQARGARLPRGPPRALGRPRRREHDVPDRRGDRGRGHDRVVDAGDFIELRASAAGTDGDDVEHRWEIVDAPDAGDGVLEHEDTPRPEFYATTPGTYRVRATVRAAGDGTRPTPPRTTWLRPTRSRSSCGGTCRRSAGDCWSGSPAAGRSCSTARRSRRRRRASTPRTPAAGCRSSATRSSTARRSRWRRPAASTSTWTTPRPWPTSPPVTGAIRPI